MNLSRRHALALGGAAVTVSLIPVSFASAASHNAMVTDAIAEYTGGADVAEGGVTLTAPEIAENGNTVPVGVDAPGATGILLLADGNPAPIVIALNFGPLSGGSGASTRIRLAGTQNVVAVAKMADGTFKSASAAVKVTIGGCGG